MLIRKLIYLITAAMLISCAANAQNSPVGDWAGTLNLGGGQLRLIFHITGSEDNYSATIESVDQGGAIIPTEIEVDGDSLRFTVAEINVEYNATLSGNEIIGEFNQFGMTMPDFTLVRVD